MQRKEKLLNIIEIIDIDTCRNATLSGRDNAQAILYYNPDTDFGEKTGSHGVAACKTKDEKRVREKDR